MPEADHCFGQGEVLMKTAVLRNIFGLFLVGLVLLAGCRRGARENAPKQDETTAGQVSPLDSEAPSPLKLELTVNDLEEATLTPDAPLILKLAVSNAAAREASDAQAALEGLKTELSDQVGEKRLTQAQADWLLMREATPSPVLPIKLILAVEGFSFTREEGPEGQALPWQPRPIEPRASVEVSLDDQTVAVAAFVAYPDGGSPLAQGVYHLAALYEGKPSDGHWSGKIISNTVTITVKKDAATVDEKLQRLMAFAEYYLMTNDLGQAEKAVHEALAEYPELIRGLYLQGRLLETKGDYRGALESYQEALSQLRRRFPESEPPWGLREAVQRMYDKLGIRLPEIIE
jgi:hypothetical protein